MVYRCQSGEMDAFKELYIFYSKAVHRLALSMLGDLDEANDLLQDLFLKVYDKIGQYRFKAPFAAWFYRLAVNLCQDRLRKRSRRVKKQCEIIQQFHIDDQPSGLFSGEKDLLLQEKERVVRQALWRVHPRYRVCLILREIEGCSYEEIASILKIPVGTVRSRLGRGRYQLRQLLLNKELKGPC